MSYDEGETWPVSRVVDPGITGYSDVTVTPDGMIHCIYEGGSLTDSHFLNNQVSVVSFSLEWLTNGRDRPDKNDKPLK
jgi:sialidase-1